jgi:hypothetical protein
MKPRRAGFLIRQPHPVQRGFELKPMRIHCGPKARVPHIRSKPFAGLQTHDKDSQMLHICLLLFARCNKKQTMLHTPIPLSNICLTLHPGMRKSERERARERAREGERKREDRERAGEREI